MARNQVIDLRRNFQPQQQSPIVSGLEGLMSGFNQQSQAIQKQKNTSQALEGLGFAREESEALSRLPEPVLLNVMKQLSERGYSGAPQGGASQSGAPQMQQIEQMFNANKSSPTQETLQGMSDQLRIPQGMRQLGMENQQPQQQQMQQQQQPFQQQQPKTAAEALRMQPRREQREEEKINLQKEKLAQQERHFERKMKQTDTKEDREVWKDTDKLRDEFKTKRKAAIEEMDTLEEMKKLMTGNAELDTPGYLQFLERSGLNIKTLMKPGTQQFMKLRQQFMKRLRPLYGGRVTNLELEQFMEGIPDLSQSPEGMNRVISQFEKQAKIDGAGWDIMWDIIDKNNGKPPRDIERQIEKRLDKVRDKAAKEFREDLKRPIPKPQAKYVTMLQSIAGSGIGKIGSMLKGAGSGAALGGGIGSIVPALGTTGGALIGGGLGALGGLTG